jgi:hypothetical protein
MEHDYDQRPFRAVGNAPGGEAGAETVFHYRQEGEVIWAGPRSSSCSTARWTCTTARAAK